MMIITALVMTRKYAILLLYSVLNTTPLIRILLTLCLILGFSNTAHAATTILNANGGQCPFAGANGGITTYIGDSSHVQVERCSASGSTSKSRQYYNTSQIPPSNFLYNSIFLRIGSTVYGANTTWASAQAFTQVSNSGGSLLGDGVTTTVYRAVKGGLTYTVTQTTTYVFPNDFYSVKLDVQIPAGNTEFVRLYGWTDIMLDGDDNGTCSRQATFPEYIVADNTAKTVYAGYRQRSIANHWHRYYCGLFATPTNTGVMIQPPGNGNIDNSINAASTDVGATVQWDIGTVANTTFTAEYDFVFSVNQPTLTKRYGPSDGDTDDTINAGATTAYTFTVTNRPGLPAQGSINFTETLPAGVTIVGTPTSSQCSGTVTKGTSGGRDTITLTGGSLVGGIQSCDVTMTVTSTTAGVYNDPATNISATNNLKNLADATLTVTAASKDYSDALATYGTPSHTIVAGMRLGATAPDAEAASQPNAAATLDDSTGIDDEDGITLPSLNQGQTATITATVAGAGGYLQGWVDFNGDGDFADASEQVATNIQDNLVGDINNTAGVITFYITVPGIAVTTQTYARFRWSTTAGLDSTIAATNGEVEDYALTISTASLPYIGGGACPASGASDILFVLDNSGSIDAGEYSSFATQVQNVAAQILAGNPANRIAVAHYAGSTGVEATEGQHVYFERDFSTSAVPSPVRQFAGGGAYNSNWYQDNLAGAIHQMAYALDGNAGTSSPFIVGSLTETARDLSRPLQIVIFTDANRYTSGMSAIIDGVGYGYEPDDGSSFTIYNLLKNQGVKFGIIPFINGFDDVVRDQAAAAIASVGGSYTGSIEANTQDPEGTQTTPRRMVVGTAGFTLTAQQVTDIVSAVQDVCQTSDYGDAPASYGSPSHVITNGIQLGVTAPDAETAPPTPLDGTGDGVDEDGVILPSLAQGQVTTITATVAGAGGYLQGWIDWNGDGDFADVGEQIATNLQDNLAGDTNNTGGIIAFNVNVPATAVTTQTYARFRWSTTSGLNSTASASNGEVEDYALTITAGHQLSGVVFEDINYGGGAGRNLAAASGVGINGTTVELYNTAGALVATTTTANNGTQDGAYTFNSVQDGNYYVRVVSDTVSSTRSGTNGAELGVQTFRTDGTTAVTSEVGGHNPAVADGAANSGTQTLDTGTYTLSGGSAVQSLQPVTLTGADVAGVDFGFNFDTIVNTNDTGQGSLRQFILNSNLLGGEASLAQAGSRKRLDNTDEALPASHESSIFMIPTSALTSGVARIAVPSSGSLLPSVTGSKTILDATTQTVNQGDTNSGLLGTGGTVGVDALSLPQIAAPEVELYPAAGGYNYAVHLNAANVVMRGFAAYGFGVDVNSNGIVVVGSAGTGAVIEQNVLGSTASSFTTPALRGDGSNIQTGASGGSVRNNLIGFSRGNGLRMNGSGWTVSGNEIRGNGTGSADGLWGYFGSSMLIQGNLITDSASAGYDGLYRSTFRNNTVTANGRDSSSPEDYGVSVVGDGSVIDLNIFTENLGQAILVYNNVHATTLNNIISRNSLFDNGKLGIDITPTSNTEGNGITLNDANDADTGANAQLNFPQFTKTIVGGSNLTISGCAPAGATIELFEADVSPTSISGIASGANQFGKTQDYGEGETYLSSWVEGIGEDVAPSPINCSTVVDADGNSAAGMSPFQWTIPMPTQLIAGDFITATATLTGAGTSEFSAVSMVVNLDYGDAPSSYDTPSHAITSGLQLGATAPDVETAPQPSATANGDDSNGTDDEDGISNFPDLSTASQTYTLNVVVNNTSGNNARLVGWIDLNRDGAFGTDEAATTNVANGSSNQAIGLKWKTLPALQAGDTYLRLRLTTDTSIATGTASTSRPDGAANDGEVEDYMLTIANGGFTVSGKLFRDTNVDGVANGTEKGIKDVTIVLYDSANGTCRSTHTGANGSYQFTGVEPAAANNYVLYEAAGEKIQTPTACPPAANDPSGFLSTTVNSQTLTVTNADVSGINFGDVQQPLFELDNQKTILPGTTVAYPHTFRTPADGVVDFSLATAADPSQLAWGTQLYLDNNCDAKLGSGDTIVDSPLALLAGDKLCLLVKVLAPTTASAGATHTVEISSTFTFGDGSSGLADVVQTHSDITTTLSGTSPEPVGGEGKLSLVKSVWNVTRNIDGAVALPGETLRYTIAYENIGNGNVVELVINDTVPEFTQLVPGSLLCTDRPAGLPACTANSSADGSLDWTWAAGDKLAPGAHGSVSYQVVVE